MFIEFADVVELWRNLPNQQLGVQREWGSFVVALVVGFVEVGSEQTREIVSSSMTMILNIWLILRRPMTFIFIHREKVSYLSNQGFLEGRPPSWDTAGLFLESDSITILMLLFGTLSGEKQTLTSQFSDHNAYRSKREITTLGQENRQPKHKYSSMYWILRVCEAATVLMAGWKVHACFKIIYSKLKWLNSCKQYLSVAGLPPPLWGQSGWVSGR